MFLAVIFMVGIAPITASAAETVTGATRFKLAITNVVSEDTIKNESRDGYDVIVFYTNAPTSITPTYDTGTSSPSFIVT